MKRNRTEEPVHKAQRTAPKHAYEIHTLESRERRLQRSCMESDSLGISKEIRQQEAERIEADNEKSDSGCMSP